MKWFKRCIIMTLLGISGVVVWLWVTLLSPWCYERPGSIAEIEQRTHQVFVYGTLTYAPVRWMVMRANGKPQPAQLNGFQRNGLDISVVKNSQVEGLRLTVTPEQLKRLDRYERLGSRYTRQNVTLADGSSAWVYRRLPDSATIMVDYHYAFLPHHFRRTLSL